MNYRHAFHAGNFADVFKHALLARIIAYLKQKPQPFRYLDTHAGVGVYDLEGDDARRTGEWRNGVGRIEGAFLDAAATALLAPYLDAIAAVRARHFTSAYPGSPALVRALARRDDRLTLVERHPKDAAALRDGFGRDARIAVVELDGYVALNAYVPPRERRGLVLVDPPFEERDEWARMSESLQKAYAKWPTGCYALWYPVKDPADAQSFADSIVAAGLRKVLRLELFVRQPDDPTRLSGCGLVVVNPPWTLLAEAETLLAALVPLLAQGPGASWRAGWIAGE